MKDFQRGGGWKGGNKFGGGSKFGGGRPKFGGGRSNSWGDRGGYGARDERPMMHPATCNECGNSCEVPFRPNGRKPIYCTNCFKRDGDMGEQRFGGNRRESFGSHFENTHSDEKRMFTTNCDECGNSCEVPFRPNGRKPTYCTDCFGKNGGNDRGESKSFSGGKSNTELQEELRLVNAKLDTILEVLGSLIGEVEDTDEDEDGDDAEEVVEAGEEEKE